MNRTALCLVICLILLNSQPSHAWKYALGAGIVTAVAAPFAIPAALGAIGFTASGIAAGSLASSIMASYGGAVTAGSACAIMQSVGAAGIGLTGTLAAGASGAAAGALYENTKGGSC